VAKIAMLRDGQRKQAAPIGAAFHVYAESLDDEAIHARIQLCRALDVEAAYPDDDEIDEIIDEILSRIELLEMARLWCRMSARLARVAA
jgi:hypothetical protein